MLLIFVSNPCVLPIQEILSQLPSSDKTKVLSYWDSSSASFVKQKGILWSKQRSTSRTALVIEGADGFSSQGVTDLMGMVESGFSRDIVLVVSNVHRLPEHVIQRSKVYYSKQNVKIQDGWFDHNPVHTNLDEWCRILRC